MRTRSIVFLLNFSLHLLHSNHRAMFSGPQQAAQQTPTQPAFADPRAFGLVLPGYPVVFDTAFQRVAADRWVLPIEFAQVRF